MLTALRCCSASELPFTSLMQLEMADTIVRSQPYDYGGDDAEAINPEELMTAQPSPDGDDEDQVRVFQCVSLSSFKGLFCRVYYRVLLCTSWRTRSKRDLC